MFCQGGYLMLIIEEVQNEDVYDFTVEYNHNFFANEILVHNCGV